MPDRRSLAEALPLRRRTVLGGVALAALMLTVLTLAGVLSTRHKQSPDAEDPVQADTLSGSQPELELEAALLTANDLADGAGSGQRGANRATVVGRVNGESHPAGCTILLNELDDLVSNAGTEVISPPRVTAQARSQQQGPDSSLLSQLLTTFAEDGATSTFHQLSQVGDRCRDFGATLEDGTAVRVHVERVEGAKIPEAFLRPQGETQVFKLTMTAPERVSTGYLAVGRTGKVLSVLRQLGAERASTEAQSTTESFLRLLDRAATKLVPAAPSATPSDIAASGTADTTVIVDATAGDSPSSQQRR